MFRILRVIALTILPSAAILPALAQHPAPGGMVSPPTHQHRFDDPKAWSRVFDDPARDKWQKPGEVIRTLALKPNDRVADIGAGTGYFAVRLARAVPEGTVFAADIAPKMVEHLGARAKAENLTNMRAVQAGEDSPRLPEPVDVILLVNTYHHIEKRADYFRKLKASLKPGGRVAIIDFKLDAPQGPPKRTRISAERITAEMKQAGYALARAHGILPHQNFLIFKPI